MQQPTSPSAGRWHAAINSCSATTTSNYQIFNIERTARNYKIPTAGKRVDAIATSLSNRSASCGRTATTAIA